LFTFTFRLKAGVVNGTDAELETVWAACGELAKCAGALVVGGLLFEVYIASINPAFNSPLERWGSVVADALIAIGVLLEILFTARGSSCQGELQRRSNVRLSEATRQAGEANERAAHLQKMTAWRHLTPQQVKTFQEQVRGKVAYLDLLVEWERADPEAYSYGCELTLMFRQLGARSIRCGPSSYIGPRFGLRVEFDPSFKDFAVIEEGLMSAAIAADIALSHSDLSRHLSPDERAPNVYIFVAPKPPPPYVTALGDELKP
jgi:hypothetical protein